MKQVFFLVVVALALSGCSLFGGNDTTDLSASENPTAQATPNVVQAVPADGTGVPVDQALAPLPTAMTLPATPVPPQPTVDRSKPTTYVVQSGDVLGLIAEKFDIAIADLRRENNLSGNLIRVGQELIIPAAAGSTSTASGSGATAAATSAPRAPAAPSGPVSCASSAGYCIQPGDSLTGIAVKLGTTVDALRASNPDLVGDLIRSGQTLNTGGAAAAPAPVVDTTPVDPAAPAPSGPVSASNDAGCLALNPAYPYFHATDGQCYANPIAGGTPVPTVASGTDGCPTGYFLYNDGLCYPKPAATATPTSVPTTAPLAQDFGRPPCRTGYVVIVATNRCWPEAENTNPTTVTPVP